MKKNSNSHPSLFLPKNCSKNFASQLCTRIKSQGLRFKMKQDRNEMAAAAIILGETIPTHNPPENNSKL